MPHCPVSVPVRLSSHFESEREKNQSNTPLNLSSWEANLLQALTYYADENFHCHRSYRQLHRDTRLHFHGIGLGKTKKGAQLLQRLVDAGYVFVVKAPKQGDHNPGVFKVAHPLGPRRIDVSAETDRLIALIRSRDDLRAGDSFALRLLAFQPALGPGRRSISEVDLFPLMAMASEGSAGNVIRRILKKEPAIITRVDGGDGRSQSVYQFHGLENLIEDPTRLDPSVMTSISTAARQNLQAVFDAVWKQPVDHSGWRLAVGNPLIQDEANVGRQVARDALETLAKLGVFEMKHNFYGKARLAPDIRIHEDKARELGLLRGQKRRSRSKWDLRGGMGLKVKSLASQHDGNPFAFAMALDQEFFFPGATGMRLL